MSSDKPPAAPQRKPVPQPKDSMSTAEIVIKVILALIIGAIVLTVLVFGTCLLLMRR